MIMTILLSGPASGGQPVRTALAGAGLANVVESDGRGFPPGTETEWSGERDEDGNVVPETGNIVAVEVDHAVAFVECVGDIDVAAKVADGFGWRLRSHWEVVGLAEGIEPFGADNLTAGERLLRVERDLQILKGGEVDG